MWKTEPSSTIDKSLEEVLTQLKAHPNTDSVLLMGSAATHTLGKHSDIDITVIVHELPENILGINTVIENKFAEIYLYSTKEVNALLEKKTIDPYMKEGWIIRWVRDGEIIIDKSGVLEKLQTKSKEIKDSVSNTQMYTTWQKINYNYTQNMRYYQSGKDLYLQALDIRLLYSVMDLIVGYFLLRNIAWLGEKKAINWLQENDTSFLKNFQTYLRETDRTKKVELYKKLIQKTLEPARGLWKEKINSIVLTEGFNIDEIEKGFRFWNELLEGKIKKHE